MCKVKLDEMSLITNFKVNCHNPMMQFSFERACSLVDSTFVQNRLLIQDKIGAYYTRLSTSLDAEVAMLDSK